MVCEGADAEPETTKDGKIPLTLNEIPDNPQLGFSSGFGGY